MADPAFEAKLDELLEGYRHVVWESYQLPFFSLRPMLIFMWQYILALCGVFVDIVLLPYTLVALFLRLFKVRWRIIAPFSKRFWYALVYASRGEWVASIVIRPVVRWLVKSHISRRLRSLGELVATSESFTADARVRIGAKIDEAIARFPVRDLNDFFKDSLIPALVLGAISFATDLVGDEEQKRVLRLVLYGVVAFVAVYFVAIVVSGFPIKRGLFLGRDVKQAPFPGGVKGQGLYALEHELFARFPVRPREVSLDMSFLIISAAINPIFVVALSALSISQLGEDVFNPGNLSGEVVSQAEIIGNQVWNSAIMIAIYIYIRIRRGMLKRH